MESEKMTISQGLRALKRLRGELATVMGRAQKGSSWQAGRVPEYLFQESWEKYLELSAQATRLHGRILRANASVKVTDVVALETEAIPGDSTGWVVEEIFLSEATLRLSEIKGQIALLSGLNLRRGEVEREPIYGYGSQVQAQQPVVYESALSERERDRLVEDLRAHFERLNDALEMVNHAALLPT